MDNSPFMQIYTLDFSVFPKLNLPIWCYVVERAFADIPKCEAMLSTETPSETWSSLSLDCIPFTTTPHKISKRDI